MEEGTPRRLYEEVARSAIEGAERRLRERLAAPVARAREAIAMGQAAPQTPTTTELVAALEGLLAAIETATTEGGQ